MSKKYEDQLMKFQITNDKIKMEIRIKDLAWLLKNSPNNYDDNGNSEAIKVKPSKYQEFAEYVVHMLMDIEDADSDNTRWGKPFEDIFEEIFEGDGDEFIKHPDNQENDE